VGPRHESGADGHGAAGPAGRRLPARAARVLGAKPAVRWWGLERGPEGERDRVGALEEEKGAGAGGLGAARIGGPLRWDAAEA